MKSILAMACVLAVASPGAASAQARLNLSVAPRAPDQAGVRAMTMPVIDYVAADDRFALRREVVAGIDLSPQMAFGLGFFEGAPKRRIGATDPAKPERTSRRAAVGLSLKF